MIGTAARAGVSLGLHLRATHNDLNAQALEARHRLFWSIFSLENLLSIMTGRASCLRESTFSAPPPLASEDMHPFTNDALKEGLDQASKTLPMIWTIDQDHKQLGYQRELIGTMKATDELYFFCLIDLILILHTASAKIYSKEALKAGWGEIESRIDLYNNIMLDWRAGLPDCMNFDTLDSASGLSTNEAYRVCLALHYNSARIILNRPCLTRKKGKEGFQSHLSRTRRDIEMTCLESALAIISILPEQPNTIWYRAVTWWSVLHYLVQSTAIFLINISYADSSEDLHRRSSKGHPASDESRHSPDTVNPKIILAATEKALRWLYYLGQTGESARKAFNLCNDCVRRMESKYAKLSDLITPNHLSDSTGYEVPTDDTHQQSRCKENVSHDQFAGTVDFSFDGHVNGGSVSPEMWYTNEPEPVKPSIRIDTLEDGTDMADYIPDSESPTFDDILQGLA